MLIFDPTRLVTWAIFIFVAAIAVSTFGNGSSFDAFSTLVVIGAAWHFRKNIDIFSTLCILLFSQITAILLFNTVDNLMIWKLIAYGSTGFCIVWFKNEPLKHLIAPLLMVAIAAEIYWFYSDYDSPQIFWSFILIACNTAFRSVLLTRPILLATYLNIEGNINRLDWYLYRLYGLVIIAESLQVIEYLARHLTSYTGIYYYIAYTYIMHTLCAASILIVLNFCHYQYQLKTIKA